jgi:hypothetical protein
MGCFVRFVGQDRAGLQPLVLSLFGGGYLGLRPRLVYGAPLALFVPHDECVFVAMVDSGLEHDTRPKKRLTFVCGGW